FWEGHEAETPAEVWGDRNPGSGPNQKGWRVRVVPNKFPALARGGRATKHVEGIYEKTDAVGVHEVIIDCPLHETNMARLSGKNIRAVLSAYRARPTDLKKDHNLNCGLIFKNEGQAGGASLAHCHSQVIALPVIPTYVRAEIDGGLRFFGHRRRCIYCEMAIQACLTCSRIVLETPNFVAFAPYASRFPFETWIL